MIVIDLELDYTEFFYNENKYRARLSYLPYGVRDDSRIECFVWFNNRGLTGRWVSCDYPLPIKGVLAQKCTYCRIKNIITGGNKLSHCSYCGNMIFTEIENFDLKRNL